MEQQGQNDQETAAHNAWRSNRRRSTILPGRPIDENAPYPVQFTHRRRSLSDEMVSSVALVAASGLSIDDDSGAARRRGSLTGDSSVPSNKRTARRRKQSRIFDDPAVTEGYNQVPLLESMRLPRGGTSIATTLGRIQFGIPPETIKDSMRLGMEIPRVYIVPVDRFCREVGPALGINLAECEFPAYFNWFVKRKKCTLVVDSVDAEKDIRSVFEETLLGPAEFRNSEAPKAYDEEDFDPSFPLDSRPNFYREFQYFRKNEKTETSDELTVDVLLDFVHFIRTENPSESTDDFGHNEQIGVPPLFGISGQDEEEEEDIGWHASTSEFNFDIGTQNTRNSALNLMEHNPSLRVLPAPSLVRSVTDSRPIDRPSIRLNDLTPLERQFKPDGADADSINSDASGYASPVTDEDRQRPWVFSLVKWLGEVATIWPSDATAEQIANRSVARVEIFKMPGGSEYIVHEVDANNYIVGKARLSGTVEVPDEIAVEGFLDSDVATSISRFHDGKASSVGDELCSIPQSSRPFYPPSFGVTILGNSHGFDKNGSTSGYVIWINGRGVMVDPPPYSSATLEREGIRPQTIIAIVLTHCHADHDAGAFQKLLTGNRVAIITTPSIYKSFIRKYSALSGLSTRLLRRSHRFRAAIIGQPLRFQGATFHFHFTLHTIPCIALKVEWRGKSVVFTGDHLNLPPLLNELEESGVLSKGRADSLRQLPVLDCDILLHEAGAPPIHTPLSVLQDLPSEVKERLFVVHTSALPEDCELRVAPVGTAGTIRLDQQFESGSGGSSNVVDSSTDFAATLDDGGSKTLSVHGNFVVPTPAQLQAAGFMDKTIPPLVYQRPTCVSDAWFILNLLSNIPFFSSLSYMSTMMVLEIASVEIFCVGDVVVPAAVRKDVLCVIWEGTCMDRSRQQLMASGQDRRRDSRSTDVWYAGDWLGPPALQPNENAVLIGEMGIQDIIAVSPEGVKAIFLPLSELEKILKSGSALYRKYLKVLHQQQEIDDPLERSDGSLSFEKNMTMPCFPAFDQVVDVLKCNSVLGKLPALQKRSLESIAEGPRVFQEGEALWSVGDRCDYAFLIVAGLASFSPITMPRLRPARSRGSIGTFVELRDGVLLEADKLLQHVPAGSEYARLEVILSERAHRWDTKSESRNSSLLKAHPEKTANDRFANKVLARLYAGRKYTSGIVFGRGCFLCDASRMVSGELVHETGDTATNAESHLHTSNLTACPGGCVAIVFPKATLFSFLDENPGTLLCLLGTQAVI